jgi:hypothetical protein
MRGADAAGFLGKRSQFGGGLGFGAEALFLGADEGGSGAVEGTVGGVDHAGEFDEAVVVEVEGVEGADEGRGVAAILGMEIVLEFAEPHLVVAIVEAAELPFVLDQEVEEIALVDVGGLEGLVVLVAEGLEVGRVFAGDDEGAGVDTGFDGIGAGGSFARGGAGSGGFARVGAVGGDLTVGGHGWSFREIKKAGARDGGLPIGGAFLLLAR